MCALLGFWLFVKRSVGHKVVNSFISGWTATNDSRSDRSSELRWLTTSYVVKQIFPFLFFIPFYFACFLFWCQRTIIINVRYSVAGNVPEGMSESEWVCFVLVVIAHNILLIEISKKCIQYFLQNNVQFMWLLVLGKVQTDKRTYQPNST